jgi:hypothetical protein
VSTLDDWEIFTKAALMGLKIETMPESFMWYREDQEQDSLVHSIMNGVRSVRPYTVPRQKILPSVGRMVLGAMQFGQGLKFERDVHIGSPLSRGEQGPAVTG